MNRLLDQLRYIGIQNPRAPKRLITSEISSARELIRTLSRSGADVTGWEAANLRLLAEELSCVACARQGKSPADDIRIASLINRAIDEVAAERGSHPGFERHAEGPGFREAVRDAVLELRTMGVKSHRVAGATKRELTRAAGAVLERYEKFLDEEKLVDPAAIFRLALDEFDSEAPFVLHGMLVIAPGIKAGGLRGELTKRLVAYGAIALTGDTPSGVSVPERMTERLGPAQGVPTSRLSWLADLDNMPPDATVDADVDIYAASSPYEEVREAIRRALNEGRQWDEIELVATDSDTYGIALDTICTRLDIGMTSLRGIPLRRTRIGQCFVRWMAWLADGLPADTIRAALESEELIIPGESDVSTARLAPLFRTLQVGWGKPRYKKAIEQLASGAAIRRLKLRDDDDSPENEARKAAAMADSSHLRRLLSSLLKLTPDVPERGRQEEVATSPSALALAGLGYIALLRCRDDADCRTLENLRTRLSEIAEAEKTVTSFALALSTLDDGVRELRAWSSASGSKGVLSSQGGKIFLTDVANAGVTGRKRTFVLGLDADSVGGTQIQDPVLPDSERRAIDTENLASSAERRAEKRYTLYRSLASLRGKITLSYATASEDGRQRGPAHVLLQAFRLAENNPAFGFEELHKHLTPPACAVPKSSTRVIDSRDAWLGAIGAKVVIADGSAQVYAAFPGLASGSRAMDLRRGTELCAHHGLIPASAGVYDPRSSPDRVLSPSSFELMGRCPLAWFYKYGAAIIPPIDPEYSPEAWLNALDRGSLLHSVFEEFGNAYMDRQEAIYFDEAVTEILALVEVQITDWKVRVPPPNEIICSIESDELRESALSFLTMERETRAKRPQSTWREFEKAFGEEEQSSYKLRDGSSVRIRGRIDRIDDSGNGDVIVIDYKTGKAARYFRTANEPQFKGGRQLQPAIYAEVVETLLGAPVARFEYWFPTPRGANTIVAYSKADLADATQVIEGLLDHVATGAFLPTTEGGDCRFCDYKAICRVQEGKHNVTSPLAEWAKANQHAHPHYASMRARRGEE